MTLERREKYWMHLINRKKRTAIIQNSRQTNHPLVKVARGENFKFFGIGAGEPEIRLSPVDVQIPSTKNGNEEIVSIGMSRVESKSATRQNSVFNENNFG